MNEIDETPAPEYVQGETPPPHQENISLTLPSTPPHITYTLIGITILVYLLQLASKFYFADIDYPAYLGMKINEAILAGQLWRFITPVFLHGSLIHIAFSIYALFVLGQNVERLIGHFRFLMLYLSSAFAGNVFSFYFMDGPSMGAGAAVFGLLAAEGIFLYLNKDILGQRAKKGLRNIGVLVLINFLIGMLPQLDFWGIVGGLLGGLIFAWFGGAHWEAKGVFPLLTLEDRHDTRDALVGTLVVMGIFGALAIVKFIT